MANYPELKGKVAVITGSSKGLGRAIAERYAKEGVHVVLNYRSSEDEMNKVIQGIEAAGGKAVAVKGDVAEEGLAEKMIETAVTEFGKMDIFVNNAGVQVEAKTHEMELDNWKKIIDTNLTGTFLGVRAALKYFVDHEIQGNIINMSSVHEVIPRPGYTHYAASKGGVKMFTKSVALEYAPTASHQVPSTHQSMKRRCKTRKRRKGSRRSSRPMRSGVRNRLQPLRHGSPQTSHRTSPAQRFSRTAVCRSIHHSVLKIKCNNNREAPRQAKPPFVY